MKEHVNHVVQKAVNGTLLSSGTSKGRLLFRIRNHGDESGTDQPGSN